MKTGKIMFSVTLTRDLCGSIMKLQNFIQSITTIHVTCISFTGSIDVYFTVTVHGFKGRKLRV